MALSMYQTSVPAFQRTLKALDAILDKASANAGERRSIPAVLTAARLSPDMFTLPGRCSRPATSPSSGRPPRRRATAVHDDSEKTFADLKRRIAETLDFIGAAKPEPMRRGGPRDQDQGRPARADVHGQEYCCTSPFPTSISMRRRPTTSCATTACRSASAISWAAFRSRSDPAGCGSCNLDFAGEPRSHRFVASASLGARVFDCGSSSVG